MKKLLILLGLVSIVSYVFALSLQKESYGRGTTSASEMKSYTFEQKDQMQKSLESHINDMQKQLKAVKSANRDNWDTVRDETVQMMEGDDSGMGDAMYQSQAGGSSSTSGTSRTGRGTSTTGSGPRDTTGMDTMDMNTSMNDTNATDMGAGATTGSMNDTNTSVFGNEMGNTTTTF
ncbi:MAG: hypothetical protein WC732_06250 [Candidatus Omnitrophota bacterium]